MKKLDEARQAVVRAADHYAVQEGSGGDTRDAVDDFLAALADFEQAVREDENGDKP